MRTDDLVFIGVMLAAGGSVVSLLGAFGARRHKQRMKRLDMLETALQRPDLDDHTRREILRVLTAEQDHGLHRMFATRFGKADFWLRIGFVVGWLMFLFAGGMWLFDAFGVISGVDEQTVVPMVLVGLAMMTLPQGLREFARRDRRLAGEDGRPLS